MTNIFMAIFDVFLDKIDAKRISFERLIRSRRNLGMSQYAPIIPVERLETKEILREAETILKGGVSN